MIRIQSPGVTDSALLDYDSNQSIKEKIDEMVSKNSYAVCDTAGNVAAKTISLSNFTLGNDVQLVVKFTNKNTAANPTLNVNSTGAKAIKANGEVVDTDTIKAGCVFLLAYDTDHYEIIGGVGGAEIFIGTQAEWDALTTAEKTEYDKKLVCITDDTTGSGGQSGHVIVDNSDNELPPERDLQFKNSSSINASTVTDDDENGRTIVTLPTVPTIINHLRSTDQDAVLSAKQGNVLANDLASYVLSDTKPSTQIDAGKFFVDKDGILRVATANIGTTTDVDNTNSTVKSIGEVLTELNSNKQSFIADDNSVIKNITSANDSWVATEDCFVHGIISNSDAGYGVYVYIGTTQVGMIPSASPTNTIVSVSFYIKKGQTLSTYSKGSYNMIASKLID